MPTATVRREAIASDGQPPSAQRGAAQGRIGARSSPMSNETARQRGCRRVGVAARAERQGLHFARDRRDHARMAVSQLVHAVAVEVEDASPVDVGQHRALRPHDLGQARRRQRLSQEVALVLVERGARPLAQGDAPRRARRRHVPFAFARRQSGIFHLAGARSPFISISVSRTASSAPRMSSACVGAVT